MSKLSKAEKTGWVRIGPMGMSGGSWAGWYDATGIIQESSGQTFVLVLLGGQDKTAYGFNRRTQLMARGIIIQEGS
jgi:hypothetical protein